MPRVFVCGEALIDFVPTSSQDGAGGPGAPGAYVPKPGGSPFNAAKAAARAGADVAFVGAFSTDFFGDQLIGDLEAAGVDCALSSRTADPTTLAFVDFATGGPRYAFFNNGSATANMAPDPARLTLRPGDIVDVGSISLIDTPGADNITDFAAAIGQHAMLSIDPNARPGMIIDRAAWDGRIRRLFDVATIIKLSVDDLDYIAPGTTPADFAARQTAAGTALVVVTDGEGGATAHTANANASVPAYRLTVVDTVGAGDTLMGSMLAWIGRAGVPDADTLRAFTAPQLTETLLYGTTAAALNCRHAGCNPPSQAEIAEAVAGRQA